MEENRRKLEGGGSGYFQEKNAMAQSFFSKTEKLKFVAIFINKRPKNFLISFSKMVGTTFTLQSYQKNHGIVQGEGLKIGDLQIAHVCDICHLTKM